MNEPSSNLGMDLDAPPVQKIPGTVENWENGALGCNHNFARRASPEIEKQVNETLGLEEVHFKMDKETLGKLKEIADGLGYVPQVVYRAALADFARNYCK